MAHEDRSKNFIRKFGKVVLIAIVLFIIGGSVFFFFKIKIQAHDVLREAKNVRMALRSADIELYGVGKSVFNPIKANGLEDGAKEKADKIYQPEGTYKISSYDTKEHEITGMSYRYGNYLVTFSKKGDNISWDVHFQLNVYHSDESDVIVD